MSRICKVCGAKMEADMPYCPKCGVELHREDPACYLAPGCPLLIVQQAVIVDAKKDAQLQMTFYNLAEKAVIACFVQVNCYDAGGEKLEALEQFEYKDFYAKPGTCFGDDIVLPLSDPKTRRCSVAIHTIVLEGGKIIHLAPQTWKKTVPPKKITYHWEQFQRELEKRGFPKEKYSFVYHHDTHYWTCCCGAINLDAFDHCVLCNMEKETADHISSKSYLEAQEEAQKEEEAEQRHQAQEKTMRQTEEMVRKKEEERRQRELQRLQEMMVKESRQVDKKATKLVLGIGIPAAAAAAIFLVVLFAVILPKAVEGQAQELIERGNYVEAIATYQEMGNTEGVNEVYLAEVTVYLNQKEEGKAMEAIRHMTDAAYREKAAQLFMDQKAYPQAIEILLPFSTGESFEPTLLQECYYQQALLAAKEGDWEKALERMQQVQSYGDYQKSKTLLTSYQQQVQGAVHYEQAMEFLAAGYPDKAKEELQKLSADYPDAANQLALLEKYRAYDGRWQRTTKVLVTSQVLSAQEGKASIQMDVQKNGKKEYVLTGTLQADGTVALSSVKTYETGKEQTEDVESYHVMIQGNQLKIGYPNSPFQTYTKTK